MNAYELIVELTQDIAEENGIEWNENQAVVAYEAIQALREAEAA